MKKTKLFLCICALIMACVGCGNNYQAQNQHDSIYKEIINEGYLEVATPVKINLQENELSSYYKFASLDEFERFYFSNTIRNIAEGYVIKGVKVSSKTFKKDLGFYNKPFGDKIFKVLDVRMFTLTTIKVEEIIASPTKTSSLKKGDTIVICETNVYSDSKSETQTTTFRPLEDNQFIGFIRLNKEPLRFGNEINGYDILDGVWECTAFSLTNETASNFMLDEFSKDVKERYIK